MNTPAFSLGISPCPNDTFIFEALLHGRIHAPFSVDPHITDVEELNKLARSGALDVTTLSMAAVPEVLDRYMLVNAGAALGRGCGPLVIARPGLPEEERAVCPVAIPGLMTTANLLLSLCGKFRGPRLSMPFDQVMPAVLSGEAGLGVIIHEGRFTYAVKGLDLVLDLGEWWEKGTGRPLPLGVIAVKRDLGEKRILQVQAAIRDSLDHAYRHSEESYAFIRSLAQEMDEDVLAAHISTFVNAYSFDLGEEGQAAVLTMLDSWARETGKSPPAGPVFAPRR